MFPQELLNIGLIRDIIDKLMKIDLKKISLEEIALNIALFEDEMNDDIVNEIYKKYGSEKV